MMRFQANENFPADAVAKFFSWRLKCLGLANFSAFSPSCAMEKSLMPKSISIILSPVTLFSTPSTSHSMEAKYLSDEFWVKLKYLFNFSIWLQFL